MDNQELLFESWKQASNEAIYWNGLSNEHTKEITKQLLFIASILIPLIGSIVITPSSNLNDIQKVLIVISIGFLFISIFFGFSDIEEGHKFFNMYTQYNSKRAINYHNALKNNTKFLLTEDKNSLLNIPPYKSNQNYSIIQKLFVFLGIFFIIPVIVILLFK